MANTQPLGKNGPAIPRLGYGAMAVGGYYGAVDEEDAVATVRHAIDRGLMIDTADAYGEGHNESLVAKAIAGQRRAAFVATKFGIVFAEGETGSEVPTGWGFSLTINGRPDYVNRALDASLKRLGGDYIDLYYAHFPDPSVPIEETVGAMADAVKAGKVRHLGLSNVNAGQLRRAATVHPIAAVQYEYSLWRREAESEILPAAREVGAALVAWSPLGAGFLGGSVEIKEGDFRAVMPRFNAENLAHNRDRFAPLGGFAEKLGVTSAQLALAWLLHQGDDVFAIPGTRKKARIDENAKAADIEISADMLAEMNEIFSVGTAVGETLL